MLDAGRGVVVAHPERYRYPAGTDPLDAIRRWRDLGAYLQVNLGSLTGYYDATGEIQRPRLDLFPLLHDLLGALGCRDFLQRLLHAGRDQIIEGLARVFLEDLYDGTFRHAVEHVNFHLHLLQIRGVTFRGHRPRLLPDRDRLANRPAGPRLRR